MLGVCGVSHPADTRKESSVQQALFFFFFEGGREEGRGGELKLKSISLTSQ